MSTVLFIVTSARFVGPAARATGYEFSEVAHPYFALREHGIDVAFASPAGGTPPEDGYDERDPASKAFRESDGFAHLNASMPLAGVDIDDFDAIFFPGGLGPMVDLAHDPTTKALVRAAWVAGKTIGAVCHGSAALLSIPLPYGTTFLTGTRVASFTRAEEVGHSLDDVPFLIDDALRAEGAIHESVAPFQPHVVVDDRLVTGQNPASARGVGRAMADILINSPSRSVAHSLTT